MKFKGINALYPCRFCKMKAISYVKGKKTTYYLTTAKQKAKNNPNYRKLPARTHCEIARQAEELEGTTQKQLKKKMQVAYGMNGKVGRNLGLLASSHCLTYRFDTVFFAFCR